MGFRSGSFLYSGSFACTRSEPASSIGCGDCVHLCEALVLICEYFEVRYSTGNANHSDLLCSYL